VTAVLTKVAGAPGETFRAQAWAWRSRGLEKNNATKSKSWVKPEKLGKRIGPPADRTEFNNGKTIPLGKGKTKKPFQNRIKKRF
jgi:hypothetical protein